MGCARSLFLGSRSGPRPGVSYGDPLKKGARMRPIAMGGGGVGGGGGGGAVGRTDYDS